MAEHDGLGPLPPLFDPGTHWRPLTVDTEAPHVARVYDFLLGGKDHFRADRAAAELLLRANPYLRDTCRQQRDFLRRAVRALAKSGVRQFVDIGTGLPAAPTTHQVARAVDPTARVVYVDNTRSCSPTCGYYWPTATTEPHSSRATSANRRLYSRTRPCAP